MATEGGTGGSEAAADGLAVLAEGVIQAEAKGPKAPQASAGMVAEALRRRAAGESYAAISRGLGVPAKQVSRWCREAAQQAPASPLAAAAQPVARKARAVTRGAPRAVRFPADVDDRVMARVGGGESVSTVVTRLVRAGLGRTPDVGAVLSDARRRELNEGLVAVSNALGDVETQVRAVGRLDNLTARFLGVYRELPLDLAEETRLKREQLAAVESKIDALRAAVDRLAVGG